MGESKFMFDTCALNRIVSYPEHIDILKQAEIKLNYKYFITEVQERELNGIPDRTLDYENPKAYKSSKQGEKALQYIQLLNMTKASCIATAYKDFTRADGSMRFPSSTGRKAEMFDAICLNNNHHKRDAMIAEASINEGCILITVDNRLYKKINQFYPDSSKLYDDFISSLKNIMP